MIVPRTQLERSMVVVVVVLVVVVAVAVADGDHSGHSGSGGGAVPTTRGVAVADEIAGASILIVARSPTPPPVTPDMGISAIRRCQPTQRVGLWGSCSSGPAAPGDSVVGE